MLVNNIPFSSPPLKKRDEKHYWIMNRLSSLQNNAHHNAQLVFNLK